MSIVYVGIDLAKNVFALHGVNALVGVELSMLMLMLMLARA